MLYIFIGVGVYMYSVDICIALVGYICIRVMIACNSVDDTCLVHVLILTLVQELTQPLA